jgi:hypothetical protein
MSFDIKEDHFSGGGPGGDGVYKRRDPVRFVKLDANGDP